MKILYITRHAKSSWSDPLLSDFERPLNDRGLRDVELMPDFFVGQGEEVPQYMVSSSAKRALQTAKTFQKKWKLPKTALSEDKSLYHANTAVIYNVISGLPDKFDRVMLFGHNPGITEIANHFADHNIDNVPTCGICKIGGGYNSME